MCYQRQNSGLSLPDEGEQRIIPSKDTQMATMLALQTDYQIIIINDNKLLSYFHAERLNSL